MDMKSVKLPRFRGINNRLPLERLRPLGDRDEGVYVHDAANVDLTDAGSFQRRPGCQRVGDYVGCRGLFEHKRTAFFAAQDKIMRINDGGAIAEIGTITSPYAPVVFCDTPQGIVLSDSYRLMLIENDALVPLVPPMANPVPTIAATTGGTLAAGEYAVTFVTETATGRRSSYLFPQRVTVSAGGAVSITAAARAHNMLVFMTAADGEMFYRVGEMAPGDTSLLVTANNANTESVSYKPLLPMYPGDMLAYYRGRLYSALSTVLHYSEPYALGLNTPGNAYILLPDPIAVIAAVDEGMYIATTAETFFLTDADPSKASLNQIAPYGAIPHTAVRDPRSNAWMWHTPRGPVAANGGRIELLQDDVIAYAEAAQGASMIRESNGLRSLVTALAGTMPTGAAVVGSFMDAEVIKGA